MLTGVRATYGGPHGSSVDPDAKLTLAAERFDASIRDRLVHFLEKALPREASARFESAAAMRRAWTACFAEPSAHPATTVERAPDTRHPFFLHVGEIEELHPSRSEEIASAFFQLRFVPLCHGWPSRSRRADGADPPLVCRHGQALLWSGQL
jgi:hypothetical protein